MHSARFYRRANWSERYCGRAVWKTGHYCLLVMRQLLFSDNSKYNKRWYNRCREKSYHYLFPHSPHTLNLFVQFGFFPHFCIIFWFGLQLAHTCFRNWKEISFSLESLQNIEVVFSLSLGELTAICETKQNEKMLFVRLTNIVILRKGITSFVN